MKVKKIEILNGNDIKTKKLMIPGGLTCQSGDLAKLQGIPQTYGNSPYWINSYDSHVIKHKKEELQDYISDSGSIGGAYNSIHSGVRISIPFEEIEDFDPKRIDELNLEYPIFAITGNLKEILDQLFQQKSKMLLKTGRYHDILGNLYTEYSFLGTRFIKYNESQVDIRLFDGSTASKNSPVYIGVNKIPFEVDTINQIIYSKLILLNSIYDKNKDKIVDFEDSLLKEYLNTKFLKSIQDELEHKPESPAFENNFQNKTDNNRYNFDYSEMSEEDILETCIKCNIAVFMHGAPGVGKTARMLTLDRNLELVDFGCTSTDGFTGIIAKDFNSKELFLYEPYWYKNLCKKCREEPDKIHILFLDELTNATKEVQKVAFEVTLNKTLTNSGFRLHLPENAVVCAAGNETKDSKSANVLSAPLFSRMAHVYIETDSNSWLKWALKIKKQNKSLVYNKKDSRPSNIHPAIIDFIRVYGDEVLTTPFNGKTPNADPRKWELASLALYECNNPNVLRAFIGEELTKHFIAFTTTPLVTVEDIIKGRVDIESIPDDPSLRTFLVKCLARVDEEHVDIVREFIEKLSHEYLSLFDYEWSKGNDERIVFLYQKQTEAKIKRLSQNGN